jgi:hypothetical protein
MKIVGLSNKFTLLKSSHVLVNSETLDKVAFACNVGNTIA